MLLWHYKPEVEDNPSSLSRLWPELSESSVWPPEIWGISGGSPQELQLFIIQQQLWKTESAAAAASLETSCCHSLRQFSCLKVHFPPRISHFLPTLHLWKPNNLSVAMFQAARHAWSGQQWESTWPPARLPARREDPGGKGSLWCFQQPAGLQHTASWTSHVSMFVSISAPNAQSGKKKSHTCTRR